jgi:hypothetical protein
MASGSQPPDGQPSGAPGRLIRHRWLTAAGTTATVAALAGGGLALVQHPPAASLHRDCGLVPCSATLPSSVTASATGPPRAPAPARPAPARPAPARPAPARSASARPAPDPARSADRAAGPAQPPADAGLAAGPGQPADQIGVRYVIRHRRRRATRHLVIVQHGAVPVTGWPGGWWRGPQPHGYGSWPGPGDWPGGGWPGPGDGWTGGRQPAGPGGWPGGR